MVKHKFKFLIFSFPALILLLTPGCNKTKELKFQPTWESLAQYQAPEWFRDAKFGIYMHWGPMTVVPGNSGWYGRHIYMQYNNEFGNDYAIHVKNFGHPSVFGYKDIIPMWKAENWDPDAIVKLIKEAGAKYVGCVAVHHDNFDCYNSSYQPWNSVNMGPKRDIVGGWKAAIEKQGLRFGVSSHSDRTWGWFSTSFGSDSTGPLKGHPYDGNMTLADGSGKWWNGYNPADLYTRPHSKYETADKAYCDKWLRRTLELIDKYQPDFIYFDGPVPIVGAGRKKDSSGRPELEKYGLEVVSHFYNSNIKKYNGGLEAVVTIKSWGEGSIKDNRVAVQDIEKGGVKEIQDLPWQTDTSLPPGWFYNGSEKSELSDTVVIHNLCDIVSKNGNMMLNIGLRPDGTLPENEREILKNIGKWFDINGEAIYGTRPWITYGEGPTGLVEGEFKQNTKPYTFEDIRFTAKENTLYAIVLGWPEKKTVKIRSLNSGQELWFGNISSIELLGNKGTIKWKRNENGLEIQFPDQNQCKFAYVLKIK